MPSVSPEAYFDCLAICRELGKITGGAGELEIVSLSYLSCLLAAYDGQPPSDWGYDFAATKDISPYSAAIASTLQLLVRSGVVDEDEAGLTLTERGLAEAAALWQMSRFAGRHIYIDAACRSAIAMPLP